MMNFSVKKFILTMLIGIPIGVFINESALLISMYLKNQTATAVSFENLLNGFLTGGLCGALFASISLIYNIESISLFSRSLIHALSGIVIYIFMGYLGNWFSMNISSILLSFIIFLGVYIIVWTAAYLREKRKINEINDLLNK